MTQLIPYKTLYLNLYSTDRLNNLLYLFFSAELSIPQDTSKSTSGEFLQTLNWEVNGVTQKGTCPIKGALLFHGRDEATLAYLQKNWKKNLERAKRVFSERHSLHNSTVKGNSGSDSLHLFECDHDSSSGGNNNIGLAGERKKCNHCEQDVMSLLGNAGPDINWMPNKMRANAERLLLRLKTML